jgi:N-acetylmuramoyl-L-alanine amidase
MITDIFISAGHTNNPKRDRGAISGSRIEGVLTAEARIILYDALKFHAAKENIFNIESRIHIDSDDTNLNDTLQEYSKKTKETSLLLDIHFNAANGKAGGTEVLIPEKYTAAELEIADRISDIFGNELGTPERGQLGKTDGVKTEGESNRGKLGWMRLLGNNILIEVEFLDNIERMKTYDEKKLIIWDLVASYVIGLIKQSM